MNGYVTVTEGKHGWTAWLTETQPPKDATAASMFWYPGEVHFFYGATKEAALRRLEAETQ